MAHPFITAHPRLIAAVGLTGALLIPAAPVVALGGANGAGVEDDTCIVDVEIVDQLCTVIEGSTGTVAPLVAPVTDAVGDIAVPVIEALPADVLPDVLPGGILPDGATEPFPGGEEGNPPQGTPGAASGGSAATPEGEEPTKVEAAGKGPTEVTESQAPAADDGRVASGPTIQPLSTAALGGNMPGIRSQNGVTLQPFDAPMVSIPMAFDAPQVAGVPVTTASPAVVLAAEAMSFAGDAVLPHTSGAAGWVTAAGLGLLAGAGVVMRRRAEGLTVSTLDD